MTVMRKNPSERAPGATAKREDGAAGEAALAHGRGSTERVVKAAIRDFSTGHYSPGQRLIESELMKRYEVGRGTIREAIRRLSGEGLVTISRFRGASIRTLSRREMVDVLTILEVLNGLAARQAARNIEERDNRARFQAVFAELMALRGGKDFFEAVRKREVFFDTIVACSDFGTRSSTSKLQCSLPALVADCVG